MPYKTIDLFAGVGGIRLGFEKYGCKNVFTSEIDPVAQKIYEDNFGERPFGDINDINPKDIPDHDILLAGFPCQPFSVAGKLKGFADTRGTLFFNIEKILEEKKPFAFMLENVKGLVHHDDGKTMYTILNSLKNLKYNVHTKILNTLDFGLPQRRNRVFIIGFMKKVPFSFPRPKGVMPMLDDILEDDDSIDPKYCISNRLQLRKLNALKKPPMYPSIWYENMSGGVTANPYSCTLRVGGGYDYLAVNGKRKLTEKEMMRLQGFPKTFKMNVSYAKIKRMMGNSVSVPVIEAIAKQMLKSMNYLKMDK